MSSIGIISTFSDVGYEEYGHWFVNSVKKFVDPSIQVFLYTDNVEFKTSKNITIQNLEKSVPELTKFKIRNCNRVPESFMFDAVRFSHKSYCLFNSAQTKNVDILCWLDSDSEIINKITPEYIEQFVDENKFVSYLGRGKMYTETGFLVFNMRHHYAQEFFERFIEYYNNDTIYNLSAQLDCHVFDAVRLQMEQEGKIKNNDISPKGVSKNHFDSALNGFITHYKGDKKSLRGKYFNKAKKRQEKILGQKI